MPGSVALTFERANAAAAAQLEAQGVSLHNWSREERMKFREAAQTQWDVWAQKSPEAKALVESHRAYLKELGLLAK